MSNDKANEKTERLLARASDVIRRSDVEDAEDLVRGLERALARIDPTGVCEIRLARALAMDWPDVEIPWEGMDFFYRDPVGQSESTITASNCVPFDMDVFEMGFSRPAALTHAEIEALSNGSFVWKTGGQEMARWPVAHWIDPDIATVNRRLAMSLDRRAVYSLLFRCPPISSNHRALLQGMHCAVVFRGIPKGPTG